MSYTPHTQKEITQMLEALGESSVEALFDEIPQNMRSKGLIDMSEGLNEIELNKHIERLSGQDYVSLNFIGAGAYQHHIPAPVWSLASRGEYYTCYTPYQAEVSQGSLQLIFEYQTMIASLCGMDVANASMYDGASALAEAVLMAVRANKKNKSRKILIADFVHPHYVEVIKTLVQHQKIELVQASPDIDRGFNTYEDMSTFLADDYAAVIIPQPNFLGKLTEVDAITDWAHKQQTLVIAQVNPIALALLKSPGQWGEQGADIVCGEGQPLGIPLSFGGPYFGFMATKSAYLRQLPGRVVGQTEDKHGNAGYVLTLQPREQHIRRAKATSNICTNQGLMVTAATIYMSLLGAKGLKNVAIRSHQNAAKLSEMLSKIEGVECLYQQNFFHEFVIRLPVEAEKVLKQLSKRHIQGGYALGHINDDWQDRLLVCTTEIHDNVDLEQYCQALTEVLDQLKSYNTAQQSG